jgi:hypothetical protein
LEEHITLILALVIVLGIAAQWLAWRLQLPHPRTGAVLELSAPPPAVWAENFPGLLSALGR